MKTKREKVAEKKAKAAAKKSKAKSKKEKIGHVAKRSVLGVLACVSALALGLTGCQSPFERADPSSKAASATYGAITVTASEGSTVTLTLGDGAFTTADGDGTTTATASNAARADAELTTPGDWISTGIGAAGSVICNGINAYSASRSADAKANANCPDCAPSVNCADGSCTP